MKIYTRTGDEGQTGLVGGSRVFKNDLRISAIGSVDELNASLAIVRATLTDENEFQNQLLVLVERVQHELFNLGAELATPELTDKTPVITSEHILNLEQQIDGFEDTLPPLTQFILPGGCLLSAQLHSVRAVCRRAEREIVTLGEAETLRPLVLEYVNRLSDLLFVIARAANQAAEVPDIAWKKE